MTCHSQGPNVKKNNYWLVTNKHAGQRRKRKNMDGAGLEFFCWHPGIGHIADSWQMMLLGAIHGVVRRKPHPPAHSPMKLYGIQRNFYSGLPINFMEYEEALRIPRIFYGIARSFLGISRNLWNTKQVELHCWNRAFPTPPATRALLLSFIVVPALTNCYTANAFSEGR